MIIAVPLSLATDIPYRTDSIELGGVNRFTASKLSGGQRVSAQSRS